MPKRLRNALAAAAASVFAVSLSAAAERGPNATVTAVPASDAGGRETGPVVLTQLKVFRGNAFGTVTVNFEETGALEKLFDGFAKAVLPALGPEVPLTPKFRTGNRSYATSVPYRVEDVTLAVSSDGGGTLLAAGAAPDGAPLKVHARVKGFDLKTEAGNLRGDVLFTVSGLKAGRNAIGIEAKRPDGRKEQVAALTVVRLAPDLTDAGDRDRYFLRSIESGNAKGVADAIRAGADVDKYFDVGKGRRVPGVFYAVATDNPEILRLLLAHKAKVDAVLTDRRGSIDDGMSPLMAAVNKGNRKMVELLIAAGADVNHTLSLPKPGRRGKNIALAGASALIAAVARRQEETARLLIAAGADVNRTLPNSVFGANASLSGASPLILAAYAGLEKTVATLIEAGADVNYRIPGERRKAGKNPKTAGLSAIIVAKARKHAKIVKMLVDAGAK